MALFDGAPMIDHAARLFSALPRYAVSARAGSGAETRARHRGIDVLHDDPALPNGPLAGVLRGLAWARAHGFQFLATAPCDAPRLPPTLVNRLAESIGAACAAFATTHSGEHPLCALWTTGLYDSLNDRLQSGEHPAVRAFLAESGARAVAFSDAGAFANANTPAALAALETNA